MFFNLIKEIDGLRKETNMLLGKEMPNISLEVTIKKKWHTQKFEFISLKS